jgi:hypothetical protein
MAIGHTAPLILNLGIGLVRSATRPDRITPYTYCIQSLRLVALLRKKKKIDPPIMLPLPDQIRCHFVPLKSRTDC